MTTDLHVHPHVAQVADLLADALDPSLDSVLEVLDRQARRLLQGHGEQHPGAGVLLRGARREWAAREPEALLAEPVRIDDARDAVARDQGFADWSAVEREAGPLDPRFEEAVDAVVTGDRENLLLLLAERPGLARERSPYGHRATLLHYLAANGVETRRQTVPRNAPELARLLLAHGAEAQATCRAYGDDHTPLALLESSAHPEDAGVRAELAAVLRGRHGPGDDWRAPVRRGFLLGMGFWLSLPLAVAILLAVALAATALIHGARLAFGG